LHYGTIFAYSISCAKNDEKSSKFCQNILTQKKKDFACNLKNRLYNVDIEERERKREREMRNLIVLNTKAELIDFLNNTSMDTLVNSVAFASDLLEMVRENDNLVEINEDLGFCDDGGWIEIDEMGYVVKDFAIC